MRQTPKQTGQYRISVNNFVASINKELFGILNERMLERGFLRVGPIGGGARLYEKQPVLKAGGERIETEQGKAEARFYVKQAIDQDVLQTRLKRLKQLFLTPNATLFETTVHRELYEELCHEEIFENDPIINKKKLTAGITDIKREKTPLLHQDESSSRPDTITNYIWYLHHLTVSQDVFETLAKNNNVFHIDSATIRQGQVRETPLLSSLTMIHGRNTNYFDQPEKLTNTE